MAGSHSDTPLPVVVAVASSPVLVVSSLGQSEKRHSFRHHVTPQQKGSVILTIILVIEFHNSISTLNIIMEPTGFSTFYYNILIITFLQHQQVYMESCNLNNSSLFAAIYMNIPPRDQPLNFRPLQKSCPLLVNVYVQLGQYHPVCTCAARIALGQAFSDS